jgi:cbb3-type cytochrome oxidase maturation protein
MGTLTFLIILSFVLGIGAWLFFVWSVKSGQYDDIERPKHRMMDDNEDGPAPRKGTARSGEEEESGRHDP